MEIYRKVIRQIKALFSDHIIQPDIIFRIFKQEEYNQSISNDGVVTFPWLSQDEIDELKSIVKNVSSDVDFEDVHIPTNFRLSAFNNDSVYKKRLFNEIHNFLEPKLTEILPDYVPLVINVFEKVPNRGYDPVNIHQNPSFVDEPEFKSVSIWIPLQDVRKENGTVGVLRGSNNKFNRMRAGNMAHEKIFSQIERKLEENYFEPLDLKAGEIAILDDSIIHWSYPNVSNDVRTAVQLIMVPSNAQHIYYFYNESGEKPMMDLFEVDKNFFFEFNCKEMPSGLKKIRSVPFEYEEITEKELLKRVSIQ